MSLEENRTSAREAGLRYVNDARPGLTRKRKGKEFAYFDARGKTLRAKEDLARIRHLAIPPAWEDVWICPLPNGHLQATGRDVKGRKQYRYHAKWREARDETKYDRMVAFGKALPAIRRKVARDLNRPALSREKVLATIVRLLETTLIRIGNDDYARTNHSYGLTTMHDRHVKVRGETVTFTFKGKSGINHVIDVQNRKLAGIVRKCRDLPGYELFQYPDGQGNVVDITSSDVNEYLHEITKAEFTAKDFRTWSGTVLAARALQEFEAFSSQKQAKQNMLEAIKAVSGMLGNTPAICRRCYVHPIILDTYLDGSLIDRLQKKAEKKLATEIKSLRPEEAAVLMLLQQTLKKS